MARVSCIAPGVTAVYRHGDGGACEKDRSASSEPEVIIVIDSLAAREHKASEHDDTDNGYRDIAGSRHGKQTDGHKRVRRSGAKVVAIGVPTVIDVTTVIRDALAGGPGSTGTEETEAYIKEHEASDDRDIYGHRHDHKRFFGHNHQME